MAQVTACVTGASGMVGRRIVAGLLARGCRVRVLTRHDGCIQPGVDVFKGGLSDSPVIADFMRGADMVFHCAGELRQTGLMHEVNVLGTQAIVEAVRYNKVKYFCHLSSAGVVGCTSQRWVDELTPCNPQNMYETTKLEGEMLARQPITGCSTVILRPTNVVDEHHLGELGLPFEGSFKSRMKAFVKGGECAHIVHAHDVAEAALYFFDRPSSDPRIFFVSLDDDPLNTVANLWSLHHALASGKNVHHVPRFVHLPTVVPCLLRQMTGKGGNCGNVRYSSAKLTAEGFRFASGVAEAVKRIMQDRAEMGLSNAVNV